MPVLLSPSLGLFLCLLISCSASENDTVVVTTSGPIKGKRVLTRSGAVTAYLGIPYAEAPVGKLRFQKPLPHQPWRHILEATSFGRPCHQRVKFNSPVSNLWHAGVPHSEDCLFLNVWVPHPQTSNQVPVLVWIHGGGFVAGAASQDLYDGALLAATGDVVVASMNYRLGAFGFLFLPPETPGNVGLWDQHLALGWLKENAAVFSGDADAVTLIGHSAGAASVGFHLLSPVSQALFAQAVLQSGSPNAPWAWKPPEIVKHHSVMMAGMLDCLKKNSSFMISCLQKKEASQLVDFDYFTSPTSDGVFLPDAPTKVLQSGLIPAKPLLIGVTGDDGSVFISSQVLDDSGSDGNVTWKQFSKLITISFRRHVEEDLARDLALMYHEEDHGPYPYRQILAHFSKDYHFGCPLADISTKMEAAGSPVYVYSFNHHIPNSVWEEWMGAAHGVEVPYLFGTLLSLPGINETDAEVDGVLSQRLMHYWAQFARTGSPTGPTSSGMQWPRYNATKQHAFHISTEEPQVARISSPDHCSFLATHFYKAT